MPIIFLKITVFSIIIVTLTSLKGMGRLEPILRV